jgi:hypothetical protein
MEPLTWSFLVLTPWSGWNAGTELGGRTRVAPRILPATDCWSRSLVDAGRPPTFVACAVRHRFRAGFSKCPLLVLSLAEESKAELTLLLVLEQYVPVPTHSAKNFWPNTASAYGR